MADSTHPNILVCRMKGGECGINIDSIYSVVPELNKPKTQSMVYLEGIEDGIHVDEPVCELITRWSEQLFWRDAIDSYTQAEEEQEEGPN